MPLQALRTPRRSGWKLSSMGGRSPPVKAVSSRPSASVASTSGQVWPVSASGDKLGPVLAQPATNRVHARAAGSSIRRVLMVSPVGGIAHMLPDPAGHVERVSGNTAVGRAIGRRGFFRHAGDLHFRQVATDELHLADGEGK